MRQQWTIAALVALLGLCALALWAAQRPVETASDAGPAAPPFQAVAARPVPAAARAFESPALQPAPTLAPPALPAAPTVSEGLVFELARVSAADQQRLAPALRALRPMLDECLLDVASRYPGPQRLAVRFGLELQQGQGRLSQGQVTHSTIRDPYVEACVQDSLEDVVLDPREVMAQEPVEIPFQRTLGPSTGDAGDAGAASGAGLR